MTDLDERIAQFENMAAGRSRQRHGPLQPRQRLPPGRSRRGGGDGASSRCVELNPEMSKAYQLAGEALIKAGWHGPGRPDARAGATAWPRARAT